MNVSLNVSNKDGWSNQIGTNPSLKGWINNLKVGIKSVDLVIAKKVGPWVWIRLFTSK